MLSITFFSVPLIHFEFWGRVGAKKMRKRATLNDDGQWSSGYFDTSSTYQEFLVGLATATHKLGLALAQLSMEFAIGPFIIQSDHPTPYILNLNPILLRPCQPNIRQFHPLQFQLSLTRRLSGSTFTKHYTQTAQPIYIISQQIYCTGRRRRQTLYSPTSIQCSSYSLYSLSLPLLPYFR